MSFNSMHQTHNWKKSCNFQNFGTLFSIFFGPGSKLLFDNNHFWDRNVRHRVCLGAFTWTTHYLSRFASCRKRADQGLYRGLIEGQAGEVHIFWSPVIKPKCFRMKCWTSICCGSKWIVEIWISDVSSKSLWSLVNIAKWIWMAGFSGLIGLVNRGRGNQRISCLISMASWNWRFLGPLHPTKTSRRGVASKISAGSVKLAKMNKPSCCLMKGLWF